VIAHRGASGSIPEHTVAAYREAINMVGWLGTLTAAGCAKHTPEPAPSPPHERAPVRLRAGCGLH
jgi:hypothetical protein